MTQQQKVENDLKKLGYTNEHYDLITNVYTRDIQGTPITVLVFRDALYVSIGASATIDEYPYPLLRGRILPMGKWVRDKIIQSYLKELESTS